MSEYPNESEHVDDSPIEAELVSESELSPPNIPPNRLSISGIISWLVVVAITAAVVTHVATTQQVVSDTVGGDATSGDLMQVQLVGKMLVGQRELQAIAQRVTATEDDAEAATEEDLSEDEIEAIEQGIDASNTGTYEQQLACVVITNELLGPDLALENLNDLNERVDEHGFEPSENQSILHDGVTNVINACVNDSFDDATLSIEEEELLGEKLGWIGRLAAAPELSGKTDLREEVLAEATTSVMISSFALMGGVLAIFTGCVLAWRTVRFWREDQFESRFENGFGVHNVYIETFAIWLVYFFGVQFALGAVLDETKVDPLVLNPFIMFSSLLALAWPVARGIPFSQVRQDIGWTTTKPIRDFFAAPVGYLATIPLVLMSLIMMGGLIMQSVETPTAPHEEFSRGQSVSHPIQEYVADADGNVFFWVVLSACVAAPIVEETVFRGVLYRHLRDVTAHWRITATVAFSALVNAFIFAAIHPQGVMLIPVLGSLAVGFTLMREWRGSLYPSMVMHAIHNSLVTCLMFTIL